MEVYDGATADFSEALYNATCQECGSKLEWSADFDADGTSYHASCCEKRYGMHPHTVVFSPVCSPG